MPKSTTWRFSRRNAAFIGLSLVVTASAGAADWSNPLGGAWENAANWQNLAIPGSTDAANFGLAAPYDVTFASSPIVASLNTTAGQVGFVVPGGQNLQSTDFFVAGAEARLSGGGFLTLGNLANSSPTGLFRVNNGRFAVSGFGSEVRTNNDLEMGTVAGDSFLDLTNSGVIGVRRLLAGVAPGSNATINVSGNANNTLFKGRGHVIGMAGAATLNVIGEGRFNCDPFNNGPAITVGLGDGTTAGRGWVNIDGNISLMNIKGEVRIADGPGSEGVFRVLRGGRAAFSGTNSVPVAMTIGRNGGNGQLLVSGIDSNVKLNGQLVIHQNAEGFTARVESGGRIVASSVLYNGDSTRNRPGLVLKSLGAALETSGNVDIASGRMLITDTAGLFAGGELRVGATPSDQASILFEGGQLHAGAIAIDGGNINLTPGMNKIVRTGAITFVTPDAGVIDLADNAMMVDYHESQTSPIEQVRTAIQPSPDNPISMARIVSSTAAMDPNRFGLGIAEGHDLPDAGQGLRNFFREAADNTSVLVRYTLRGDANLDGEVRIGDFSAMSANFGQAGRWSQGDFNNDGDVNISDFALLANNFNQVLPAAPTSTARGAVPEPASMILIPVLAVLAGRRRGRRDM